MGIEPLLANVSEANRQIVANVAKAMKKAMEVLHEEYRRQLKAMIYDKPESPNYQRTYRLYEENFHAVALQLVQGIIVGTLWSTVPYAVYVELGTIHMAARPAMMAAIEASFSEVVGIFSDAGIMDLSVKPVEVCFVT